MISRFHRLISVVEEEWVLTIIILGFVLLAVTGLFYNFGLPIVVAGEVTPLSARSK
jgi:hypothetical protein